MINIPAEQQPQEETGTIQPLAWTQKETTQEAFQPIEKKTKLKVDTLYANLPVFTAAPTYTGKQGEVVLVDDKSTVRRIYTYLNGTWRYANLT